MRPTATPTASGSAKRAPVRARDAGAALVELDRDDAAGDRAFDRARDAGLAGEPEIGGAEQTGADAGAEQQRRQIGKVGDRRPERRCRRERVSHSAARPAAQPCQHVEGDVDHNAVHEEEPHN